MNILFVIDKVELKYFEFNNLVTNFWLIKEFLERGNNVCITTINNLYLENSSAYARTYKSYIEDENIFYQKDPFRNLTKFRMDLFILGTYVTAPFLRLVKIN